MIRLLDFLENSKHTCVDLKKKNFDCQWTLMKSDLKHILYILEIAPGPIIHLRSDYTRIHLSIFCFGLVFAVARYCAGLSAIDKVFGV